MENPTRASRRLRVIVADDHRLTRSGARSALVASGCDVVAECADVDALLAAAKGRRPDVCLVGATSRAGRLPAISAVARLGPPPRVVVLARSPAIDDVLAAIDAGAAGYLLDDAPADRLALHLKDAADGNLAISPALLPGLVARARAGSPARYGGLTPREHEVMRLLTARLTTKQVAEQLGVSATTVRRHASSAVRKLGACSRGAAIRKLGRVQGHERE